MFKGYFPLKKIDYVSGTAGLIMKFRRFCEETNVKKHFLK